MTPPTASTRIVAVLGHPVRHSLSPVMHNAAFRAAGLDYVYVACEVEHANIQSAVHGLRALQFAGANVTIPHKQAVIPHLNSISGSAQRIGAVNTIVNEDGELFGDNTDGLGFQRSVAEDLGVDVHGTRCVVIGAGGAARAVLVTLVDAGAAAVTILNRTPAHAEALRAELNTMPGALPWEVVALRDADGVATALGQADLIVNCTSAGMGTDEAPIDAALLADGAAVYDTIYTHETRLVRDARARGLRAATGTGMLVHQGAAAFERWTGVAAPVAVMRDALETALAAPA